MIGSLFNYQPYYSNDTSKESWASWKELMYALVENSTCTVTEHMNGSRKFASSLANFSFLPNQKP